MIRIVRTTSADPAFRTLTAALDAELWARYPDIQGDYAPFNLTATDTAVVALAGDVPVGCACVKPFEDPAAVELKRMFVAPSHRGHGVASLVLRELEAWARELGFTRLVLEMGDRQPEAAAFYAAHGFTAIPLYGPYVGLAHSVCLAKPLNVLPAPA